MLVNPGKLVAAVVGAAILFNSTGAIAASQPHASSPNPWVALSALDSTASGAMSTATIAQLSGDNRTHASNCPPLPVLAVLLATLVTAAIIWLDDDDGKLKIKVRAPVSPD